MSIRRLTILGLCLLVPATAGVFGWPHLQARFMHIEASYAELPLPLMMTEADLVFVGEILDIGPTRWNADHDRAWPGGLPFHEVRFAIRDTLVGAPAKQVTLLVHGNNPADQRQQMEAETELLVGDRLLVFARQTRLAWNEDQTIPATMLIGRPGSSVLYETEPDRFAAEDGQVYALPELQDEITWRRSHR